jgi:hypothetical protein
VKGCRRSTPLPPPDSKYPEILAVIKNLAVMPYSLKLRSDGHYSTPSRKLLWFCSKRLVFYLCRPKSYASHFFSATNCRKPLKCCVQIHTLFTNTILLHSFLSRHVSSAFYAFLLRKDVKQKFGINLRLC